MTWNSQWQQVVWSDEKKFNIDGPDGFAYYWHDLRKNERIFSKRQQGGGGVMIWASFSSNFKSKLTFVEGKLDAKGYQNLLKNHIEDISKSFGSNKWIFQQDNAPIHKAKINTAWFESNKIDLMSWPPFSPDLNPIENVWGILATKIYGDGVQYRSLKDLKLAIINAWNNITLDELKPLVNSMPNKIFEVIRLGGAKTHY